MAYYSPEDIVNLAKACTASQTYLNHCKALAEGIVSNSDLLMARPPFKLMFAMLQLAAFHGVFGLMTVLFSLGL